MVRVDLAEVSSQARGIMFYGTTSYPGLAFRCYLEPGNPFDYNCVALIAGMHAKLGHLARETAQHLAPLLRTGFQAHG